MDIFRQSRVDLLFSLKVLHEIRSVKAFKNVSITIPRKTFVTNILSSGVSLRKHTRY